jgi:hypothetical protein
VLLTIIGLEPFYVDVPLETFNEKAYYNPILEHLASRPKVFCTD